jgi:hypothetical protein
MRHRHQLAGQAGSDDHSGRDQDRPQRNVAPVGGLEQARQPASRRRLIAHLITKILL